MKSIKSLGLALVAVCALGIMVVSSASGLPSILPEEARSFTGKNVGAAKLEKHNGEKVECSSAAGEGTQERSTPLGQFHITFKGCKAFSLFACTGLGDAAEAILTSGSFHIVYDTLTPLGAAILFLPGNTQFECGGKTFVVKLGGMVLCLITTPLTNAKSHEFRCKKGASAGTAEETKYYNGGGTLTSISPLLTTEGTTTEESNEQANGTIETERNTEIMD